MILMRRSVLYFLLITFLALSGCAGSKAERPRVTKSQGFTDTNRIIDQERLKMGGHLLIIPFKAGEGVEANDELDKIALMMVKGIAEELTSSNAPFSIMNSGNFNDSDLVIKGHVVKIDQTKGLKKLIPGKMEIVLKVSGELIDRKTNERLLVFSQQRTQRDPRGDFKSLGNTIGHDIGRFIMTAVE